MLTNRELASLILLTAFAVLVLARSDVRSSLRSLIRQLLNPKIAVPFAAFASYIAFVIASFGSWSGLWEPRMLKDTTIWFVAAGVVLFVRFDQATQPSFVGRQVRATFRAALFIEFYLNLVSFSLLWELLIQISATVLSLVSVVGRVDPKIKGIARGASVMLSLLGLVWLVATGLQFIGRIGTVAGPDLAQDFLLPVWLTAVSIPFIYALALYAGYEDAFRRINKVAETGPARRRAKLALLAGIHLRSPDIARFGGAWQMELVAAPTWREAYQKVKDYLAWRVAHEVAKQKEANQLVMYEGVAGSDEQGRQLDRREFAETITSLEMLSTGHMGWYRNEPAGRYKSKLRGLLPAFSRGLPDQHGIVMKVRKDGQAWYAWRRTGTGWVFAVGAKGPPPNQWFFDGPEPPQGYPGSDPAWGSTPFDRGPNWELGA